MANRYRIPKQQLHRIAITVENSQFIASILNVRSVEDAKTALAQIRSEMPDASHHVYAFRVGGGNSVIEGMSDDGEPSGTAGPPVLTTLRGTDIGDILIVITRYFGGTKLGTGGLVRAYTDAPRTALKTLSTEETISRKTLGIQIPYPLYEIFKRLIEQYNGAIQDEEFTEIITIFAPFPVDEIEAFVRAADDTSSGRSIIVVLD